MRRITFLFVMTVCFSVGLIHAQVGQTAVPYTDQEAIMILRAMIIRGDNEPLPTFSRRRLTETQAALIYAALGAHYEGIAELRKQHAATIDRTYTPRPCLPNLSPTPIRTVPPPYPSPVAPEIPSSLTSVWIDDVDATDGIVHLSDSSVWRVQESDRVPVALWLPAQRIIISGESPGDVLLVNETRLQAAHATRVR